LLRYVVALRCVATLCHYVVVVLLHCYVTLLYCAVTFATLLNYVSALLNCYAVM